MKTLTKIALATAVCGLLNAGSASKSYPEGELGRMVKLGKDIMNKTDTHPFTKDMVGDKL